MRKIADISGPRPDCGKGAILARCDTLFVGGYVVDGTGAARYPASVMVTEGRICHVGDASSWTATETVRLEGLSLCPGFIDSHTHDDQLLFDDPAMTAKVSQGVTTVITGNCGVSLAPLKTDRRPPSPLTEVGKEGDFRFEAFSDFLDALDLTPPAINTAGLVGHTTLRAATMGQLDRPAAPPERFAMAQLCDAAMRAGAIGVSSGLFYPPAMAAPTEEVTALVRIAADYGGIYAAHIRSEADGVAEALEEAFDIASSGGAPLVISHHKVSGQKNFGRSRETLAQIARASSAQRVGFDVYPYAASSTMLNTESWSAATRTLITWSNPYPQAAGRDLSDVAAEMGLTEHEALEALSPGGAVYFMMDEADVRRILTSPDAMIGSDGVPMNARPHPRLWGTFTRVLGHYARDIGLFSFEEAVRKMTSLTASQFSLTDRGVIAPGAFADLVVVDPESVADLATFEQPTLPSRGIDQVFVNGVRVWRDGKPTGARPGRVLRRT